MVNLFCRRRLLEDGGRAKKNPCRKCDFARLFSVSFSILCVKRQYAVMTALVRKLRNGIENLVGLLAAPCYQWSRVEPSQRHILRHHVECMTAAFTLADASLSVFVKKKLKTTHSAPSTRTVICLIAYFNLIRIWIFRRSSVRYRNEQISNIVVWSVAVHISAHCP